MSAEDAASAQAQSFLTDAQRAALDAALANKQKSSELDKQKSGNVPQLRPVTRKHGAVHVKPASGLAGDRKSRNAKGGAAKKKGAGGKFTWGSMLADAGTPRKLDRGDPMYDSEEDAVLRTASDADGDSGAASGEEDAGPSRIVQLVAKLKADIMDILLEYLEAGDVDEAAACLAELQLPQYDFYIVKRALTLALDRKDREREAVSVLLSALYGQGVSPQQMQKGFVAVLEDFDDLLLDVPDAADLLALFIGRAVVDEILPPAFVARLTPPAGSPLAALKGKASKLLEAPHGEERLARCWGSDARLSFADARARIKAMLQEYVASGDVAEVERRLRAMNCPFLHHEVVKQALLLATDDMAHCKGAMVKLLEVLGRSGEVSSLQIYKGFQRFVDQLDDLALDTPHLHENFQAIYGDCIARGIIDPADQSLLDDAVRQSSDGRSSMDGRRSVDGSRDLNGHMSSTTNSLFTGSSDTATQVRTVAAFRKASLETVKEYFSSTDADEVAEILRNDGQPGMLHILVHVAVLAAMERNLRERELISLLFVSLVPDPIPEVALIMGFRRLLSSCEDLILDVPDAPHMLTLFMARLVVDEVVPPVFLTKVLDALRPGTLGVEVVRNTGNLLKSAHAAERITQCWHGGPRTTPELRKHMGLLIQEYLANSDAAEAERSLHELDAPSYHHEFVRCCIDAAFEHPEKTTPICGLLAHMSHSGAVSQTQLSKGISRARARLEDSKLDCPKAESILDEIAQHGRCEKWLELVA